LHAFAHEKYDILPNKVNKTYNSLLHHSVLKYIMSSNSALKKASKTKPLSLSQDDFIFPRAPRIRKTQQKLEDTQKIFKYIDDNIIGKGVLFLGPYGRRKGELSTFSSSSS